MELVQELFLTAVLAVLFSFLVAKLVSVAMVGGPAAEGDTDRGSVVEEAKLEDRLSARGFECESKVELELVENSVEKVHRIAAEPVRPHDVGVEGSEDIEVDCRRVPDKSLDAVDRIEEPLKEEETPGLTASEEIEVDRHQVPEKSPGAVEQIEPLLKEEKHGQCSSEEVEQEDDGPVEKNSSESAPDQACIAESEELKKLMRETEEVGEEISRPDSDDEDDDWEGIERTELEKDFAAAAKFAGSEETNHCWESVGGDVKMQLFGLHKVATEGPCLEPQPMALKVSARSKWNAWQRLGNMSPDVAMEQYITLLSENVPGWKEEKCDDASKSDVGSPCRDWSKTCLEQTWLGDDRNAAVDTVHDLAESMDSNSENKAQD